MNEITSEKSKLNVSIEDAALSLNDMLGDTSQLTIPARVCESLPYPLDQMCQQIGRKKKARSRLEALIRCNDALHTHIVALQFADYLNNKSIDPDLNDLLDEFLGERDISIVFFYLMMEQYRLNPACQFIPELKSFNHLPISYEDWETIGTVLDVDDPEEALSLLVPRVTQQLRFFQFLNDYAIIKIVNYDAGNRS